MLILVSIAILVLAALVMLMLRVWRPGFGYHWLIAVSGAFAAWVMLLVSYTRLPYDLLLASWGANSPYPNSITMLVDRSSWPFAFALGTLLLATLLSDVVRAYDLSWSNWASSIFIAAISLFGVLSGTLLTFVLFWTAFDFFVLATLLLQLDSEKMRRRAVWVFFIHLLGTLCILIAGVVSVSDSSSLLFERVSPAAIVFVVLAAGLRLGALPIDSRLQVDLAGRRSFGTIRSLASMTIVAAFLIRVTTALENAQISQNLWLGMFSFLGLIALLFCFTWFFTKDELEGRQAWIVGLGSMMIASMLRADANSGISWGLAAIFSGGLIFLASAREKVSTWITLIGLIGICLLPFTPAWGGTSLFAAPFNLTMILYFVSAVFLISGYANHAVQVKPEPPGLERWIKVVYPLGLLLLPISHFGLGWILKPEIGQISLVGWIIGPALTCFSAAAFFLWRRSGRAPTKLINAIYTILNLNWLRLIVVWIFNQLARIFIFTSRILEGEGGFLWVLLAIVLLFAVLLISFGG